jgi:putative transposase
MLQAYRFALDPTPAQARELASHCGAARKAFNEGLAQVKRCLDQRAAERSYGVSEDQLTAVPWTLPALRRWWNGRKDQIAPWWPDNSKEAYNSGLDALARGLRAWSSSRAGKRRGPRTGFPRFKTRRRSRPSCRFTTGAIRVSGPAHVVLPRIGQIKTHEATAALLDKVRAGTAGSWPSRSASMGGAGTARSPSRPGGMWPGPLMWASTAPIRWSASTSACGICWWPPHPMAQNSPGPVRPNRWGSAGPLRALHRQAARRHGPDRRTGQRPSKRWRRTQDRIGRVNARAANPRPAAQGHHRAASAPPGDRS